MGTVAKLKSTRLETVRTTMISSLRTFSLKMAMLMTADMLSMTTNMLYIHKALSHQTDQGCFWFRGALILPVSRRRWSIQPLLTVSKKAFTGVQKIIQANGADEVEQTYVEGLLR